MRYSFLIFLISLATVGQSKMTKGFVFDYATRQPIPYVNLSIFESQTGTSSDDDGSYFLEIKEIDFGKNIHLSSLGFRDSIISVTKFIKEDKIYLKAKTEELDEVVISKKFEEKFLEVNIIKNREIKTGFPGFEHPLIIALYFPYEVFYESTENLNSIKVFLRHGWFNKSRSSKFRLRLFSIGSDGFPDKDLVSESIIVEASKKQREINVDVSKYNLRFPKEGFYVGLEWLYIPFNKYETFYMLEGGEKKFVKEYAPLLSCLHKPIGTYKIALYSSGIWWETPIYGVKRDEELVPAISLTLSN